MLKVECENLHFVILQEGMCGIISCQAAETSWSAVTACWPGIQEKIQKVIAL